MAVRLPDYTDLGRRPVPQGNQAIAQQNTEAPGAAMAGLGREIGAVGDRLFEKDQEQQKAKAALSMATMTNAMNDAHDQVARGIEDGTIPTDKALSVFNDSLAQVRQNATKDFQGGQYRAQFNAINLHAEQLTGALQRNLAGVAVKRNQSETAANITQTVEQYARGAETTGPAWAVEKAGALYDLGGPSAGWNPQQIAKLKQASAESITHDYFRARAVDAFSRGDLAALQDVRKQVSSDPGKPMDQNARSILSHTIMVWEKQIQADAARDKDAGDKLAVQTIQSARAFVNDGRLMDPGYQAEVRMLTRGTPWEGEAERLIKASIDGAGYGSQSIPMQRAMLAASAGKPTNPEAAKQIEHLKSVTAAQEAAVKADMWAAGATYWRLPESPEKSITDGAQLLQIAAERIPMMNKLEASTGATAELLRPAEVPKAVAALQNMPVSQRVEVLSKIGDALGQDRRIAFADQLDKGNRPLYLQMRFSDLTTAGRRVGELIALGEQAIKDRTVQKDDQTVTGWKASIAPLVRDVFRNTKIENDVIDAAVYIMAAQQVESNAAEGTSGFGQGAEKAVNMLVGKPVTRGGIKTVLPLGMTEDAFHEEAMRIFQAAGDKTVYSLGQPVRADAIAARFDDYGLRIIGKNQYVPIIRGRPVTIDKEGSKPLILQFGGASGNP